MNEYELGLSQFLLFAQSLGIGFLIGLERERHEGKIAGVRTFTLIALAGSISGFIGVLTGGTTAPWILLTLIVASLLVAQFKSRVEEPDTTTVLAAILAFLLGYILWLGHTFFPAALTIAVTAVLYFREELRDLPRRLSRQDITSFFQFAAVAFILLPILPDKTYGPYDVINPYQVGWLVVLISGLSLAGYVALRLLRGRSGLVVVGLLGGLASTTATTLVYSRHSKHIPHFAHSAATIILLSHLVLFARIAVVVTIVEYQLLRSMLPWLIGGLVAGVLCLFWLLWRRENQQQPLPELTVSNPTELKTALGFAIGFSLVLLLSAWMHDVFANAGGYVIAFLSGLTDVDAITVANLKLFSVGSIDAATAGNAVVIAFVANLLFKLGIVFTVADRSLWSPVIIGFTVLLMGVLAGLWLF
ncbi:MAG TPA: MgtC/SapB family protein [Cellvibrio sp.]|nr:MgtC/SapB family protein [Cellvibrio sp.]